MNRIRRPVLRYHGGKWRLAPWIISNFPPHRTYVEPFGGGGSVLMLKPRSFAEVYNDRWAVVVNVFRVLRDPAQAAALEASLRLTPFARDEFEETRAWADETGDPVEAARRTIFRSFAGFGSGSVNGDHSTGFRSNSNRTHTTPAHDWARYPDQVRLFVERLRAVVIENRPAVDVIAQQDHADTLFYVDPPYPHSTRNMRRGNANYAHEMTDADHAQLAEALHACRGMVVLSGYRCPLYEQLFGSWERRDVVALADGARARVECLWLNPAAAARSMQGILEI